VPTPSALDHFECYDARHAPRLIPDVSLVDEFGARTVTLGEPTRICNPADKNGEDASAPEHAAHLVGYRVSSASPRFRHVRHQVVVNQFGSITVDLFRPDLLLVPSAKSQIGAPPPLVDSTLDHFACYRTHGGRAHVKQVEITDEFGSIGVDVKQPARLCVPVSKNGESVIDPVTHLMCYEVRIASSAFAPAGPIFIDNQFGPDTLDSFRTTELCVPSLLNPGTTTMSAR
jgi:hypothetical protein